MSGQNEKHDPFIVENEDFRFTQLIDENGNYNQSVNMSEAIRRAYRLNLNLVCFNIPEGNSLALCKIIDYGKWKYQHDKHMKKAEKKTRHETKEMRFTPVISDNDIEHKLNRVKEFVSRGDSVVLCMQGIGYSDKQVSVAKVKIEEIVSKCNEFAKEVSRKFEGGRFFVTITKK